MNKKWREGRGIKSYCIRDSRYVNFSMNILAGIDSYTVYIPYAKFSILVSYRNSLVSVPSYIICKFYFQIIIVFTSIFQKYQIITLKKRSVFELGNDIN